MKLRDILKLHGEMEKPRVQKILPRRCYPYKNLKDDVFLHYSNLYLSIDNNYKKREIYNLYNFNFVVSLLNFLIFNIF